MKRLIVFFCTCACLSCGRITQCADSQSRIDVSGSHRRTPEVPYSRYPVFTLCVSEYPSFAAFSIAADKGMIDRWQGPRGQLEQKWQVDILLKEADYDTCMKLYGDKAVDAVCITNIDALASSQSRKSIAIMPTSTSVGADACLVVGITNLDALKGVTTYGLGNSVSRYVQCRNIELAGKNPKDYLFSSMDPWEAARAMQTHREDFNAIMVRQPFVRQTLKTRVEAKVLFSSATIPGEIIDCVVLGADVTEKPGADKFACALIDAYYSINKWLLDPRSKDETLAMLGNKYSSLNAQQMAEVVAFDPNEKGLKCRFYNTPDKALALFNDAKFQKETMPRVVDFCISHHIADKVDLPAGVNQIGFNDDNALLNFTDKYIKRVKAKE